MPLIENFGGNVSFVPAERLRPRSEGEVLDILRRNRGRRIRCIGSGHSWSRIFLTDEVLVDLGHFDGVELLRPPPGALVQVGAGCTLGRLLRALKRHGLTLPAIGVITRQTIAGATATATHGSGSNSLSHFVLGMRIATYQPGTREPAVLSFHEPPELRAARCALGSLGIVLRAVLPAVPEYRVEERQERVGSLEAVLAGEADWPLQQFALFPWSWSYVAIRRRRTMLRRRRLAARLHRWWLWFKMELGLHLLLKLVLWGSGAFSGGGHRVLRCFFRRILPRLVGEHRRVDDSSSVLTAPGHVFKYLEMEAFVPRAQLAAAVTTIRELVEVASGERDGFSADVGENLEQAGLAGAALALHGTWTHHYPLFFRSVHPDDAFMSMAGPGAGSREPWISISFISYLPINSAFRRFAETTARCLAAMHGARLHWGKYFPLPLREAARSYVDFPEFEWTCLRYDPTGVFWSENL